MAKCDLTKFGKKFEGVLVNIKWKDQPPYELPGIRIEEFQNINLESVIDNGIVFIWSEPIVLNSLMDVMGQKGFVYVENLQIGLLDLQKGRQELAKCCTLTPKQTAVVTKKKAKVETASQEDNVEFLSEERESIEKEQFLLNMDKLGDVDPEDLFLKYKTPYTAKSKLELMMFRKVSSY